MATPLRNILTSLHGRLIGLTDTGALIVRAHTDGADITVAAGAANVCTVTIQSRTNEGVAVAAPSNIDVWISDAATGIGLAATANTSVATASTGTIMGILTTGKAWRVQLDATGKAVLSLTDTGKTATFVACTTPYRATCSVAASACAYG